MFPVSLRHVVPNASPGHSDGFAPTRYTLQSNLQSGRFSDVYLGYDKLTRKDVVLKTLSSEARRDPFFVERFRREMRMTQLQDHPNIVKALDSISIDNHEWMVLEYAGKRSLLSTVIGNILPPQTFKQLFLDFLAAVAYVHFKGALHRDLKLDNVHLADSDSFNGIKLLDFGHAVFLSDALAGKVSAGEGTFGYMAPEAISGTIQSVESDLYSAGVMLYTALCRGPPYFGHDACEFFRVQMRDNLIPPSMRTRRFRISPELDDVVCKSLSANPQNRYHSAAEFSEALQRIERFYEII